MVRLRKLSQILSFSLFIFLFLKASFTGNSIVENNLFLRIDPLIAAAAILAGRAVQAGLLYAFLNVLLALIFGRVWCGWICPFGTLLDWISPQKPSREINENWRAAKYLLFLAVILAAIFANQTLTMLDPISILTRTMSAAVWPAFKFLLSQVESLLYQFEVFWPILDQLNSGWLYQLFQSVQSVFISSLLVFITLAIIIGLNWVTERYWCRYLCPLGGLLGLASRFSWVRRQVDDRCTHCGQCARICPTATINAKKNFSSDPAECTVCYDCVAVCPVDAITFPLVPKKWKPADGQPYDPNRRKVLLTIAGTLGGVALTGIEPIQKRQPDRLILPPGARQTDFSALCARCGECVRVCPTQGLQPSLIESGWQNIFTPHLVPRLGYCSFNCTACLDNCPTGAIPRLSLQEKQQTPIGLASVNRNRCLPWAYDTICSVCEEMCPLPHKAITLIETALTIPNGKMSTIKKPVVNRELCIGCGICEYHCPVGGEAAIQVQSLQEDTTNIQGT